MSVAHTKPADIERTSMAIIADELAGRGVELPPENAPLVRRVVHATADFDYAENLTLTPGAVGRAVAYLLGSTPVVVTDTNMALAGVSRAALAKLGGEGHCLMADPRVAEQARAEGTTRAVVSMRRAAELWPSALYAVGNAPTALFELADLMETGRVRPACVVGVPVGFVNVVEAKERVLATCRALSVPAVVALGRKGGSTVAAAAVNALVYQAADMLDPAARRWQA